MADSEALQVTLLVTSVLDDLGISYVIGGSMASIIHGMLRTTMDVDIVADMHPEQVSRLWLSCKMLFMQTKLQSTRLYSAAVVSTSSI